MLSIFRTRTRMFALLAAIAALGAGTFFGVRLLVDRVFVEAQGQDGIVPPPESVFEQERRAPRFAGDVSGIFIGPPGVPVPPQYVTYDEVCPEGTATVEVPPAQAGVLALELDLPSTFVLREDSLDTGVVACDGTVYAARWDYAYRGTNGMTSDIVIGRTILTSTDGWDVAAYRARSTVIGGRKAALIEPMTPDGLASRSAVFFPEPFGMTFIAAANLSRDDLLALAELVARATKK